MAPVVRVRDATLHASGQPVHLVVTGLDRAGSVVDAVRSAGASASVTDGRLEVVAKASQLVDAAGRTGGAELAEPLREAVDAALRAWAGAVPDLPTPAGAVPTSTGPVVMGVVNVTPDSFSDGGLLADVDAAVAHGEALAAAGATILDVGGESTRPGADPVSTEDELARTVPVVEALAGRGHLVSIDTTKAAVAEAAVAAGAAIVNDVSGGARDPDLLPTVAGLGAAYVLMHAQGTPRTMQLDPTYDEVVDDVAAVLADTLEACVAAGIDRERIVLDPGIGFGKTVAHNLELLARLRELTSFGRPVLVGASRKSFLGTLTGVDDPAARDLSSAVVAALAVDRGARILRAHDAAATLEAARVAAAVAGAARTDEDDA